MKFDTNAYERFISHNYFIFETSDNENKFNVFELMEDIMNNNLNNE